MSPAETKRRAARAGKAKTVQAPGKGFMRTKNQKTGRGPCIPSQRVLKRIAALNPAWAAKVAAGAPRFSAERWS